MILYKFYKTNCQPCKHLSMLFKTVSIPEDVEFIEVNMDDTSNQHFISDYDLRAVPTLVFENGNRWQGTMPQHELQEWVSSYGERTH